MFGGSGPGDRSGGFGDRPDTGPAQTSTPSDGISYSVEPSGNESSGPSFQASPVDYSSDGNYQQFASTRDVTKQPLFSQVFGDNYVTYPGGNTQAVAARQFNRYLNPQDPVSGKFGSLFGGAGGEQTFLGERRAVQQDRGIGGLLGGLAAGAMIPGAGFLSQAAATDYVAGDLPEGYREVDREGILGGLLSGLEGVTGAAPIEKISETASNLVDRARKGIAAYLPQEEERNIRAMGSLDRLEDAMSQRFPEALPAPLPRAQVTPGLDGGLQVSDDAFGPPGYGYSQIDEGLDALEAAIGEANEQNASEDAQQKFPNDPDRQSLFDAMLKPGVNRVPLSDGRTVLIQDGSIKSMNDPFTQMSGPDKFNVSRRKVSTVPSYGVSDTGQVYKQSPTGVRTYTGLKNYAGTQYGNVRNDSGGIMDMLNSLGMAVKPYFNLNPNRKR